MTAVIGTIILVLGIVLVLYFSDKKSSKSSKEPISPQPVVEIKALESVVVKKPATKRVYKKKEINEGNKEADSNSKEGGEVK